MGHAMARKGADSAASFPSGWEEETVVSDHFPEIRALSAMKKAK